MGVARFARRERGGQVALLAGFLLALGARPATAQESPPSPAPPLPPAAPAPAALVPPKLLSEAIVPYPEGAEGEALVTLTLVVAPDGAVRSVSADADNEPFSSRAVDAARAWRFEPATRGDMPVAARIRIEVQFRPPEPEPGTGDEPATSPATSSGTPPRPAAGAARSPVRPGAIEDDDGIEEVRVRGRRADPSRTVSMSRAEVRQIPGAFGDPFRAIEMMPGVTPVVSGLPFFFIRGAPPGNVGYFLDGVRVPLLFHVGVGPSAVHPALIERVDLYPGGYPARYGRFSGGIVAGETEAPRKELHGEYNLRLFDVGALAETTFAEKRGSVLLGGRYSYTALLLTQFSPDTTLDYWDYQGRVTYDLSPKDRIGVFAFGSYDFLGQRTQTETLTLFGTEFHRVDARYDRRLPRGGRLRVAATGGVDRSLVQDGRRVRDRVAGARTELTQPLGDRALLRAGTDLQIDSYDVEIGDADLGPAASRVAAFFPTRTDLALTARADIVFRVHDRLEVTPGARLDLFTSQGAAAVGFDPRLAMRAKISERAHFLSAMGIAHQPPSFVVPVPGFQPGGLRGGLQRSLQESVGLELELDPLTVLTMNAFHNGFINMSDPLGSGPPQQTGCAPGAFPSGSIAGDFGTAPSFTPRCEPRFEPGTIGPDRSGGGGQAAESPSGRQAANLFEIRTRGRAYGLELFLKRKLTSKLGGFLSYTLSRSVRTSDSATFIATFDRTHVANAAVAYDLGKQWRAGTRLVFYTGLPKAPDPSDPGATRLPPFFRVDLRLEKRWSLGKSSFIAVVAEWMNATLSKEAVASTCTLNGCESQRVGPVTIPSLGMEGGF